MMFFLYDQSVSIIVNLFTVCEYYYCRVIDYRLKTLYLVLFSIECMNSEDIDLNCFHSMTDSYRMQNKIDLYTAFWYN